MRVTHCGLLPIFDCLLEHICYIENERCTLDHRGCGQLKGHLGEITNTQVGTRIGPVA